MYATPLPHTDPAPAHLPRSHAATFAIKQVATNNNQTKTMSTSNKSRCASVNHPLSGKVKEEMLVEPVGFGEADVPDEVKEVNSVRDLGTTSALAIDIDDLQPTEAELSHTRSECPEFPFGEEQNGTHCPKCYCYVCDLPAFQCTDWSTHCHAHDNARWHHARYAKRNPLFALLQETLGEINLGSHLQDLSPFEVNERVRDLIDRAWRMYEAGNIDEGTFVHKFSHVLRWFKKYFSLTQVAANDKKWAEKFIVLDAITEIMIGRTFKLPEGSKYESMDSDRSPDKLMDRILLALGSRWLTMIASCPIHLHVPMSKCVRERMQYFKRTAKELVLFERGFSIVVNISKIGLRGEEGAVVDAACNLYRSITRRRAVHANLHRLQATDTTNRAKYHDVCALDDIMIPFLSRVTTGMRDETMIDVKIWCDFYYRPSQKTWGILCKHTRKHTQSKLSLIPAFKYMLNVCKADYIYSTRAVKRSNELMANIEFLMHMSKDMLNDPLYPRFLNIHSRMCAESLRYCIHSFTNMKKLSKQKWATCERIFNTFDELPSKLVELSRNTVLELGEWIWHNLTKSERKHALKTIELRCDETSRSIRGLAKSVFNSHGEQCSFCMISGYTAQKAFAITCPCSRTTRIHHECLDEWRKRIPDDRSRQCPTCKTEYDHIDFRKRKR